MTRLQLAIAAILMAIGSWFTWGELASLAGPPQPLLDTHEEPAEFRACPMKFDGFRDAVTWYRGKNRMLIEAKTACGGKMGSLLRLAEVKLTLWEGGVKKAAIYSPEGQYSLRKGLVQVAGADPLRSEGYLRGRTAVVIDLKAGELRASGLSWNLGKGHRE